MSNGHHLHVEPSQIVATKQAFQEALDGVHAQLRSLRGAHQQAWAGDPVSQETAAAVNDRTFAGNHANAAEQALLGYARQLTSTIDALERSEAAYRQAEGENHALWGTAGQ
ncbi:MAG: hypothetical protein ACRDRL_31810 [Sciscionella sp.]